MVDVNYHVQRLKQSSNPKFKRLWIGTTDLCNSRCKTCNIWQNKTRSEPLDYSFLSNPLFKDIDYILNSGGEPTLVNTEEILLTQHKCLPNATLQLSTNGLLPDKALKAVSAALKAGAKMDVGISLDGVGADHDEWRGVKGNFDKVDYLIHELNKLKVTYCDKLKITVGSTLAPQTCKHMDDLVAYAKENNVPFMWHWYNRSSFYSNEKEKEGYSAQVNAELKNAITQVHPNSLYRSWWLQYIDTGKIPSFKCYALKSFAVIKSNGDIVPCLSHWDKPIGNVVKQDPQEVWHSKQATEVRKFVRHCGNCVGCLNSWGCGWSLEDAHWPIIKWAIRKKRSKQV